MQKIWFEITDVLWHAYRGNSRVTGIQRVQLNLIRHISEQHNDGTVRCVFFDWRKNAVYEFDPGELFDTGEFDGERLLRKLGLIQDWERFPVKLGLKRYLAKYNHNKLLRSFKKIQLYAWALIVPAKFNATGLKRILEVYPGLRRAPVRRISGLPSDSSLVLLGAGLPVEGVVKFCRRSRDAGGDVVQMVHDVIPALLPQYCTSSAASDFKNWLTEAVQIASRFVCISDSTANDLQHVTATGLRSSKIHVVPLAHEYDGFSRNSMSPRSWLPDGLADVDLKFVLCVGTIEVRKNGIALLKCWEKLRVELGDSLPVLIFAGKHGWLTEEFDCLVGGSALREVVHVVDAPSDEVLAALYSHCLFTVFPSFYEGWGLPVGESAWFGKYCIASSASAIPEVCGNLVDYVDPFDQEAITDAVRKAIKDVEYRHSREMVIKRAPLRTWRQVADDLHDYVCNKGNLSPDGR